LGQIKEFYLVSATFAANFRDVRRCDLLQTALCKLQTEKEWLVN